MDIFNTKECKTPPPFHKIRLSARQEYLQSRERQAVRSGEGEGRRLKRLSRPGAATHESQYAKGLTLSPDQCGF